jgi:beta-N-acetylhexosaminidase
MVGHLRHRRLDPDWPATLSRRIIGDLLRDRLGFRGVVVTDDLQMRALRDRFDLRTRIRRAVTAGADILLLANNSVYRPRIGQRAAAILADLVRSGTIPRERVARSLERIRGLKDRLGAGE